RDGGHRRGRRRGGGPQPVPRGQKINSLSARSRPRSIALEKLVASVSSIAQKKVGHLLKKAGLITRRLGKAGRGLVMGLATMTRTHELAAAYSGAGLDQEENNLHCPL